MDKAIAKKQLEMDVYVLLRKFEEAHKVKILSVSLDVPVIGATNCSRVLITTS